MSEKRPAAPARSDAFRTRGPLLWHGAADGGRITLTRKDTMHVLTALLLALAAFFAPHGSATAPKHGPITALPYCPIGSTAPICLRHHP